MKTNHKPKFIIFDFFGVICSEIAPFWFERYFSLEKAAELKHTYLRPADAGQISPEILFQTLADLVKMSPNQVKEDWFALAKINDKVVSAIRLAKIHFKIVLCSNASSPFIRQIMKDNDLEYLFDTIIISSEIGVAKPDPDFFIKTLEILKATPEEILFIDDNPKNTSAAEKLGIHSIVFREYETLTFLKDMNTQTV